MKRYIKYLAGISFIIFCISCEEVIEFKGEAIEPKVVIYSLFDPDSLIKINLSASYPVFQWDYKHKQIDNAEVRLYKDGTLAETLLYIPPVQQPENSPPFPFSSYSSITLKPDSGSIYSLEVDVPGFSTVKSTVEFPVFTPIEKIDTLTQKTLDDNWESQYLQAKIKIKDPPGEENFYRIRVLRRDGYYAGSKQDPYSSENPIIITPFNQFHVEFDPIMLPAEDNELFGNYIFNQYGIFSDELIAGKEYDLTLKFFESGFDQEYFEFYIYLIELYSISKDLYLYLKSLSAHYTTDGDFISEPVIVYTNIQNGLGIVGTQLVSRVHITKGEFPVEGVNYEFAEDYYY